jgi:hypothetical protein
LAKVTSSSVKHSLAHAGEDTTTALQEPSRNENMGPWRAARRHSTAWNGFFRRWIWPTNGMAGGLGGRTLFCFLPRKWWIRRMKANERMAM